MATRRFVRRGIGEFATYEPKPFELRSPSIVPHRPPVCAPTEPIAEMTAIKISANITAYSTAVAASSSRINRSQARFIIHPQSNDNAKTRRVADPLKHYFDFGQSQNGAIRRGVWVTQFR